MSRVGEGDRAAVGSVASARAARPRSSRAAAIGLLAAVTGCASPSVAPEEAARLRAWLERTLADRPRPAPDTLRVYLAFAGDVDLDLYVTDPMQETVYFANTPSRAGGRLAADLQCSASAEGGEGDRAERVRFAAPPPGRYRVSVDHPRSCGARRTAGYALAVEHGGRLTFHTGSVGLREFQLVSVEFELPPRPAL